MDKQGIFTFQMDLPDLAFWTLATGLMMAAWYYQGRINGYSDGLDARQAICQQHHGGKR